MTNQTVQNEYSHLNRCANRRTLGENGEWITASGCGSRQHSRRNPTNPDKIGTQPAKKNRKNQQKSIVKFLEKSDPGGPLEPPESLRDPPGTHPSEQNAKKMKKCCKNFNVTATWLQGRFLTIFGSRPGAQNRQKTRPEAKKRVRRRRRRRFLSFFLAVAVRSRSPDRFSESPTLENPIIS